MSAAPTGDGLDAATRRIAVVVAVCPLVLGLLGVLAWSTGMLMLASIRTAYIPMAPSTALALLLLNGCVIALAVRPIAHVESLVRALSCALLALAVIKLVEIFSGATMLEIEARLVASPASFGGVPLGRMSPLTAGAIALAALSLAALAARRHEALRSAGGVLGMAVALTGVSIILGYAYGAPLLYGGPQIPAALTTGIALAGTGASLVALSGPQALPLRPIFGSAARADIAELHIRELHDRIRFALDSAGAGTWEYDMATGMLEWSEAISRMLGLPPEPVRTDLHGFQRHVHPADWPLVQAAVTRALEGNVDYRVQYRVVRRDGSIGWIQSKGRVTRAEDGTPLAMVGMAMDISDRKQLELHLQQSQKLESLGRLAGSIAHDFNNVLTAIVGFSELLHQDIDPAHPHARDVAEIRKAGEAGVRLVKQLLAFSRKQPLEAVELDVNAVVANTRPIVERLVGHAISVATELDESICRVWGDAGQIQQVLVNLAVNARDAMPDGGVVRVKTFQRAVGRADAERHEVVAGNYAVLSVIDNGVGMSEEIRQRIFEPFFTTKGPEKGTGLGLATVYGIARQSGGFVDVQSEPGRGTTFSIYLPALDVTKPAVAAADRVSA